MPDRDPCQEIRQLLATMHVLRTTGGCPWDAEQTPESLTPFILEEACEAIEAIETGSPTKIAEELGDLLLQIVFQAEIFSERQQFDFADVAAGINAKLIRRHPHVFGDVASMPSGEELDRQWERIKYEELLNMAQRPPHPTGQVPAHLPALQRAQKLLSRARRNGLVPEQDLPMPLAKPINCEDDLGMALLALVREAERHGFDAEQSLRLALHKVYGSLVSPHDNKIQIP